MSNLWSTQLVLVSVVCSLLAQVYGYTLYDMDHVCKGKTEPFVALQQVDNLVTDVDLTDVSKCGGKAIATQTVSGILYANKKRKVCSRLIYGNFENALFRHSPANIFQPLPSVIRDFTKNLAYEVSANCKISFVTEVERMDRMLGGENLKAVQEVENTGAFLLGDSVKLENSDLISLAVRIKEFVSDSHLRHFDYKDQLQPNTIQVLKNFDKVCANFFRPQFFEMIGAIEGLIGIDFDYSINGSLLEAYRYQLTSGSITRRWLNIYILCAFTKDTINFSSHQEEPKKRSEIFKSRNIPNLLNVKNKSDRANLKTLTQLADAEIKNEFAKIYIKLNGEKLSFGDKVMGKSSNKFAFNYMHFLDKQISPPQNN